MIKAKMELSPKNFKPVYDLLYGKKLRRRIIIEIIFIILFVTLYVLYGRPMLTVIYYAFLGIFIPQSFAVLFIFGLGLLLIIASAVIMIRCIIALRKLRRADAAVIGTAEYEFGEDGIFSRVTEEGFLCERFSVYSTVHKVTEYKGNFIVYIRGHIGIFTFSDICEGDADKLRELLRQKLGERFVTKK